MVKFRSHKGKHIVTYEGYEHFFDTLYDAWQYIFYLRIIEGARK